MKRHTDRLFRLAFVVLFLSAGPIAQVAHAGDVAGDTTGGATEETSGEASGGGGGFGEEAIRIARSYDDGGGYIWKGSTGVSETLTFDGQTVLEKQPKGTYCCGFTFQVAFKLAQNHGLLDGKNIDEVKRFQIEWYGSTEETAEKQCALAMEHLCVGHTVDHDDAQLGDFGNFWRTKSGHSVIFLNWITDDEGNRTGIHYRSSQTKTDGIGDRTEYFKNHGGEVDPARLYLCRFNEPKADDNETEDAAAPKPRRGANR